MSKGKLYIVSTPIGNLKDITARGMQILADVDFIAAEDTRHTKALLNALGIQNKVYSFHEHSGQARAQYIISKIAEGEDCALVSDAGTPIISDPGENLVQVAIAQGIPVYPIPGPTALIAALCVAGLDASKFVFEGFLPKGASRKKALEQALQHPYTTVFYESPHQLLQTVQEMAALYPNRQVVLCKELTKIYEQIHRASAAHLAELLAQQEAIKGEYVIVVEGYERPTQEEHNDAKIEAYLIKAIAYGLSKKEAVKMVSEMLGVGKNQVYERSLSL